MPTRTVQVERTYEAPAAQAWAVLRDFRRSWHPLIDTMTAERGADGSLIRRFTLKGEDTLYRECLIYLSDSDRMITYRHLQGIRDVEDYQATVRVTPLKLSSCKVEWSATLTADEPRAAEIAQGTTIVFETGLEALRQLLSPTREQIILEGPPALALSAIKSASEKLCLFLHGIGGGRTNWDRQLPIAAEYMQAATLDLRGYGGSALGTKASTVEDYCDDILRVMKSFGAKQLVLCGLSYGSWLATSFAMRHPAMLAGLILAGGCTGMSEASVEECEAFHASRQAPLDAGKTPADFAPAVVNLIASPHASEATRAELLHSMQSIPAATYRDALNCFTHPTERFDFSKLKTPVLFVTGEFDSLAKPDEIRGVSLRVLAQSPSPKVAFEVIPGSGHVCNVEAPDVFNTHLRNFLRGLQP